MLLTRVKNALKVCNALKVFIFILSHFRQLWNSGRKLCFHPLFIQFEKKKICTIRLFYPVFYYL